MKSKLTLSPAKFVREINRRRRPACAMILAFALILSLIGGPGAAAQTAPQPGQKDPVSNYAYFPSHDMVTFVPYDFSVQGFKVDQNLHIPFAPAFNYDQPADCDQIVAAPGHIWSPQSEQVVYARRPNGGSDIYVTFVADPPTSGPSQVLQNLAPRLSNSADFMDIAAGDLDKLPDSRGDNHDEVVVTYASSGANNQLVINVSVLDYTSPAQAPPSPVAVTTAQASHTINGNSFTTSAGAPGILSVDNVLGVAVGDFDGDGLKEIALVHLGDGKTIWVTLFRYTNDGQGNRALKEVFSTSRAATSSFGGTVDVAAADYDGKGKDELLVSLSEWSGNDPIGQTVGFDLWQGDVNLVMTRVGALSNLGGYSSPFSNLGARVRTQISPGLFKYDPDNGFDLNRRQFVAAWNNPSGNIQLFTYQVSDDLKTITQLNQQVWSGPDSTDGPIYQRFSIAAGAYKGNVASPPPLWGVALSAWAETNNPIYVGTYYLATLNTDLTKADQAAINPGSPSGAPRFPVVQFDLEGKSIYLGAPVHFMIEGLVNTDFVLYEPPKHAFYDNREQIIVNGQPQNNPTYGQIVTVSRYDETNVSLITSTGTTFAGKSTDHSNWTIGGSVQASASVTASAGVPDIAEAKVSVGVEGKVGYDYDQNKENYNSNYSERTITKTDKTDHDDALVGRVQTIDVWRYRVYGVTATDPNGQPINAFYEVFLPGLTVPFDGGGLNFDWYHPTHENGNILSYPQATGGSFTPSDLGSHKEPCPANSPPGTCNADGTITVNAPLVPPQLNFFDGSSGSLSYDYKSTTGSGGSFTYSHTLAESVDVKYSSKVTVGVPDEEGEVTKTSVDVNLHNNNSWGNVTTNDATTTGETGVTLNRSSGDSTQGYAFYPVFYTAQDGTIKVTYGVDVLGSALGKSFWAGFYGRLADPALNLPSRFIPAYSSSNALIGWSPNYQSSRKKMRGFFLRKATPNPTTNTYDLLASTPLAGDKVRLDASVYNYSTAVAANLLKVRFQVIGYNSDSDSEIPFTSCPNGSTLDAQTGRCTLGNTTVAQMTPQQMTSATFDWDTTGFGPATAGQSFSYRVYVVLDPDNTINETYELEDPTKDYKCVDGSGSSCGLPKGVDPGQNNEGYGEITIQGPNAAPAAKTVSESDVSLRSDSFVAVNDRGRILANDVPATIFQPLRLRIKVYSDQPQTDISHVMFYDGDPDQGGKMIGSKLIHSGNTQGASAWIEWMPRQLGKRTLYARVLEKFSDGKQGNHTDTLTVNVTPKDTTPPQLALRLTPNTIGPANGQFVPITAHVTAGDNNDPQPEIRLEAITHNQANNASPDVKDAAFGTDDRSFSVRAQSRGGGAGKRVYTVVYSAADWAGNKTFLKAYVLVP